MLVRSLFLVAREIGMFPETEMLDDAAREVAALHNALLRGIELVVTAPVILNDHVLDEIEPATIDLEDGGRAIDGLSHERLYRGVGHDRNENRKDEPAALQDDVPIVSEVRLRFRRMEIDRIELRCRL